jgi:hypothetical protein
LLAALVRHLPDALALRRRRAGLAARDGAELLREILAGGDAPLAHTSPRRSTPACTPKAARAAATPRRPPAATPASAAPRPIATTPGPCPAANRTELPLAAAAPKKTPPRGPAALTMRRRPLFCEQSAKEQVMTRETILLVEDEHDIRELLKFHLERDNLAVRSGRKRRKTRSKPSSPAASPRSCST